MRLPLLLVLLAAFAEDPKALPADGEADAAAVKSMDGKEKERRLRLALERISKEFAGVKTLRATFAQRKRLEVLDDVALTKGTMALEMASKLRWEYVEPVKTLLVVNGARARRERTSRKGEVTSTTFALADEPIAAATAEQVFLWVGGRTAEAAKSHVLELLSEKPLSVRATPRDERVAKVIVAVDLDFAGEPLHLSRIVLEETSKTRTEIEFTGVERNPELPADLFDVR
jgi:outer membrane lipoprotein-sorting protein